MVKNLLQVLEYPTKRRRYGLNFLKRMSALSSALIIAFVFCPSCSETKIVTQAQLSGCISDLLKTVQKDDIGFLIRKKATAVVLIHTFGGAKDDHLIYNSSVRRRLKAHHYYHGVISGVIISADGVVCTTASGIMNSKRIVVSMSSEYRPRESDSNLVLTKDDYVADVVKVIPELNLAFLKITPRDKSKFEFLELDNDGALVNNPDSIMLNQMIVIGKCKGEHFVTEARPGNAKNNFGIAVAFVEKVTYEKKKGIPMLNLVNQICGSCVIPENDGGAIINRTSGRLFGIAVVNHGDFSIPMSIGIPISVVKQGIKIAVPHILDNRTITNLGIKARSAKDLRIDQKSLDALKISKKTEKFGVEVIGLEMESAAANSGVQIGDTILKFNEEPVDDEVTFCNLERQSIGAQTVILTILRNGKVLNLEINR
jgi:S1-C subfamily serine protease